jgi:Bestrophin, RFP-TM, chloride channel/Cyclic nucleotide-binding domain
MGTTTIRLNMISSLVPFLWLCVASISADAFLGGGSVAPVEKSSLSVGRRRHFGSIVGRSSTTTLITTVSSSVVNGDVEKVRDDGSIDAVKVNHVGDLVEKSQITKPLGTEESDSSDSDPPFQPPFFNKTTDEERFVESILEVNFLFQDILNQGITEEDSEEEALPKKRRNLARIVAAFEKASYDRGSFLCRQGDMDAQYLHIIYKGKCAVLMNGIGQLPTPYGTLPSKSMFGELALLYETPRAATVQAIEPVTVFRLDKDSFNHFLYYQSDDDSTCTSTIKQQLQEQVREIDAVIDQISGVRTKYNGDIIKPFQPMRSWLWRRWRGTILQHAWKAATLNMLLSATFIAFIRRWVNATWVLGMIPDPANPFIARLLGLSKMWHYLMNITTFILTFFLSQAYQLWKDIYSSGRQVQGRLNDISMLLATAAERQPSSSPSALPSSKYTPRAAQFLEDVAVYTRLYHSLSWASLAKKFHSLLTPRGLSRMLNRGVMSREQYDVLVGIKPNFCAPHYACLMWILSRSLDAMKNGIVANDDSIRRTLIDKILTLRGVQAGMGDKLDGRIPLAYAHFVQLLVDAFLVLAPFSLYTELGLWSVPAVGLLTLFYSGLLDLSKILLDPLDNDAEFYANSSVNMDIGVLIRESNSGSNRWKAGLESLPY